MNPDRKKSLITTVVCLVIMFLLIPVAALLIGDKNPSEFSRRDIAIFIGFIGAELVNGTIMFLYAAKAGKATQGKAAVQKEETDLDKLNKRRGWLLFGSALVLGLGTALVGIAVAPRLPLSVLPMLRRLHLICCVIPPVLALGNFLCNKLIVRSFQKKNARQMNEFFHAHRDHAEETAKKKLRFLTFWRGFSLVYAVALGLIALAVGFLGGAVRSAHTPMIFYASFLFLAALSRIRFPVPQRIILDSEARIKPEDYPALYACARRAADAMQCPDEICIFLGIDCNAGIAPFPGLYSVHLGALLLSVLSREELYNILLHEFSHVAQKNKKIEAASCYNDWLRLGGNPHFASVLTKLLFTGLDKVSGIQYLLYSYASSILQENEADRAMALHGNPEIAASALLKLKYAELFNWETGTADEPCPLESETPAKDYLQKAAEKFQQAIDRRSEAWNRLIGVEILSRIASHPTIKMRVEALGVTEYRAVPSNHEGQYGVECQKALAHVDALLFKSCSETYEEDRQSGYLEPKKRVEAWEEAGRPLVAEEYGDLVSALQALGRHREAAALCQRAIAELPSAAADYAHFMWGSILLHSYDDRGLEHIYTAIEGNSNYIDEGLNLIGAYCCMTGNQEELSCYREKALELAQKDRDVYSRMGVLQKGDKLSEDCLPEGMLENILQYIRSVDSGAIQAVYLVRKTINPEFFVSAFIVRFRDGAEDKEKDEIMHKIFCHLDTCSDWQFSLFTYDNVKSVKPETIENSLVYAPTGQTDR